MNGFEINAELFAICIVDRAIAICEEHNRKYPTAIVTEFITSDKTRRDAIENAKRYLLGSAAR